jgi:hypothetical protein
VCGRFHVSPFSGRMIDSAAIYFCSDGGGFGLHDVVDNVLGSEKTCRERPFGLQSQVSTTTTR